MASKHDITTMNVSLPDAMRTFVEQRVADGGYTSASEYMRELIRKEQQRARKALDLLLPGGAKAKRPAGTSKEDWDQLKRTLAATDIDELRRSLDEAEASLERGEGRELDIERFLADKRRRFLRKKRAS